MRIPEGETVVAEAGGATGAVVTRDGRGDLHLYAPRTPLIDLDSGTGGRRLGWTIFSVMFGASAPRGADDAVPSALRDWLAGDPTRAARLYRTGAGWRCLVTSPALEAGSAEAERVLAAFGADAGERRLLATRGAWRVRLGPGTRRLATLGGAPSPEAAATVELHDQWSGAPASAGGSAA